MPVVVPSPSDLTTLANVRQFMQKTTADTGQDALISSLITAASVVIMRYAEREFAPTSTALTRTFETEIIADGWVDLAPYDLRNLTSILIDTDYASPVTLVNSEYRLYPRPNPDGVYTRIRLEPYVTVVASGRFRNRQVQVTGDWGFATVPSDVELACWFTVKEYLESVNQRNAGLQADDVAMDTMSGYLSSVPYNARLLLDRYKRMSVT